MVEKNEMVEMVKKETKAKKKKNRASIYAELAVFFISISPLASTHCAYLWRAGKVKLT